MSEKPEPKTNTQPRTNSKIKPIESTKNNIVEHYSFIIALIIVVSFVIFFGKVVWDDPQLTGIEKISSTLGNIVAAVVGYYFGNRQSRTLSKQVEEISSERENTKRIFAQSLNVSESSDRQISNLKTQLKENEEFIEKLAKELKKMIIENEKLKNNTTNNNTGQRNE